MKLLITILIGIIFGILLAMTENKLVAFWIGVFEVFVIFLYLELLK